MTKEGSTRVKDIICITGKRTNQQNVARLYISFIKGGHRKRKSVSYHQVENEFVYPRFSERLESVTDIVVEMGGEVPCAKHQPLVNQSHTKHQHGGAVSTPAMLSP